MEKITLTAWNTTNRCLMYALIYAFHVIISIKDCSAFALPHPRSSGALLLLPSAAGGKKSVSHSSSLIAFSTATSKQEEENVAIAFLRKLFSTTGDEQPTSSLENDETSSLENDEDDSNNKDSKSYLLSRVEELEDIIAAQREDTRRKVESLEKELSAEKARKDNMFKELTQKLTDVTSEAAMEIDRVAKEKELALIEKDTLLMKKENILREKDELIERYQSERTSLRKLMKLSIQAIKSRGRGRGGGGGARNKSTPGSL